MPPKFNAEMQVSVSFVVKLKRKHYAARISDL